MKRRLLIAAMPLAVAGSIATPVSPAQAAANPTSITFQCIQFGGGYVATTGGVGGISGAAGDTVTIVNNSGSALALRAPAGGNSLSPASVASGTQGTLTLGTGVQYLTVDLTGGNCNGLDAMFGMTVSGGGGGGGGSTSGASGAPAPLVQQFGMPASGTCDAAASTSLNWAGVASGGWSISWEEWMNGGRGGVVCTRTLVYDTRAAAWGVAG